MLERSENKENVRKSAILLMNLDVDTAAEVFKFMNANDVQRVSQEMTSLGNVTHDELKAILEEFMNDAEMHASVSVEASEHLRDVLTKALGAEKAASILDDIIEEQQNVFGMDKLNLMDAGTVAEMIRDEHPQIIATILVHLERGHAANILEVFGGNLRNDVVKRITTFNGVQPIALQELTEVLGQMLDGQNLKRSKMGGIRAAAEILNTMNSTQEEAAIAAVREYSEELAQKILDEMFLFENLVDLDDRSIQTVLAEIDTNSLAIALKGADAALADKFISNMSVRGAEMFREDMESRGPTRLSQVETEQKAIIQLVRGMANRGDIVIGGSDDAFV